MSSFFLKSGLTILIVMPMEEKISIDRNLKILLAVTVIKEVTVMTRCRMMEDASGDTVDPVSMNTVLL